MSGGGPDLYKSPNLPLYEDATLYGAMNRAGANGPVSGAGAYNYGGATSRPGYSFNYQNSTYPGYTSNQANNGNYRAPSMGFTSASGAGLSGGVGGLRPGQQPASQRPQFNFGQIGAPLGGATGVQTASSGFDFGPTDEAISGFRQGAKQQSPFKFDFGSLPDKYTEQAYALGAADINKQSQDDLTRLRESIGPRRAGLLMKAGENSQRDRSKQLTTLRTNLDLNRINQNLDLSRQQQIAQAGENAGAQDRSMNWLRSLYDAGQGKIGTQSGLLGAERAYQDQAYNYLLDLYKAATGQATASAQQQAQNQQAAMGNLLGLGQLGVGIAGLV